MIDYFQEYFLYLDNLERAFSFLWVGATFMFCFWQEDSEKTSEKERGKYRSEAKNTPRSFSEISSESR